MEKVSFRNEREEERQRRNKHYTEDAEVWSSRRRGGTEVLELRFLPASRILQFLPDRNLSICWPRRLRGEDGQDDQHGNGHDVEDYVQSVRPHAMAFG